MNLDKNNVTNKKKAHNIKVSNSTDFGERIITSGEDIRAIARSGWSGRIRINGSNVIGMPTDNLNYAQGLIVSNTGGSDTYMIELVSYTTGELYTCGGNKTGTSESLWIKHTDNVTGSSLFNDAGDLGLVYNDIDAGKKNADKLRDLLAEQVVRIAFTDDIYFDIGGSTNPVDYSHLLRINHGLEIYGLANKRIIWKSNEFIDNPDFDGISRNKNKTLFYVPNVSKAVFYKETDCHHVTSNKFQTAYLKQDGYAACIGYVSEGCTYEGTFQYKLTGREQDPVLQPETLAKGYWGYGTTTFNRLRLINNRGASFLSCNQMPHDIVTITNVSMHNCSHGLFFAGVSNENKWRNHIRKAMKLVIVESVYWENDIGFWCGEGVETASSYIVVVGTEGGKAIVNNIFCKNLIYRGYDIVGRYKEFYTVYMAGIDTMMNNHHATNMYSFDKAKHINVGIHLKKTWNARITHIIRDFEGDFFERMKTDHELTVEGTKGTWIAFYPEAWLPWQDDPDYGSGPSQEIYISDCKIYLPKLDINKEVTSPKYVGSFAIERCDFESPDDGTFCIIPCAWANNTGTTEYHPPAGVTAIGMDHQVDNRRIIFRDNRLYAPNNSMGYIINLLMQDERSNRIGQYVVDVSDNDIVVGSLREVSIVCAIEKLDGSLLDNHKAYIDTITVNNRVTHTDPTLPHTQFTLDSRQCVARRLNLGGDWVHRGANNWMRLDQNIMATEVTKGSYNIVAQDVNTNGHLVLFDISSLSVCTPIAKTFIYSGEVINPSGIYDFTLQFTIESVNESNLTFKYRDVNGVEKTGIWSGSTQSDIILGASVKSRYDIKDDIIPIRFELNLRDGFKVLLRPSILKAGSAKLKFDVTQF